MADDVTNSLPQIAPLAPTTIPAQPERTYGKLWVTDIRIAAPSPGEKAQAAVQLIPYDPASGTISPRERDAVSFGVADVFAEAARYPTVGQAIGALLAAIAGLYPVKHLQAQIADVANGLPQYQSELANAQDQLKQAQALPGSNVNKQFNLDTANGRIAAAQAQLDRLNAQLQPLRDALAAADAKLGTVS